MKQDLQNIGFEVVSQNGHPKIRFKEDRRYTCPISSTPG